MKPRPIHIALVVLYFAGLALAWLSAGDQWRDAVFYLTFFSGFVLNVGLGYLLWKAERERTPTE